jgi:hypothetical protein
MPPQNPRSMARCTQSTLTGPTGAATRIPIRIPAGIIRRLGISCMSGTGKTALWQGRTSDLVGTWIRRAHEPLSCGNLETTEIRDTPHHSNPARRPLGSALRLPLPPYHVIRRLVPGLVFLVATAILVHWLDFGSGARAAEDAKPKGVIAAAAAHGPYTEKLPANVEEMRETILAASHVGQIDELSLAIQWNEMVPDFGQAAGKDPIAHLTTISQDGHGLETLAVLANILSLPPARLTTGKDPENNAVYVWPYLAEVPLDTLTAAQEVDLYRLMGVAEAKAMRARKTWSWWRLSIGADGTWHSFRKTD